MSNEQELPGPGTILPGRVLVAPDTRLRRKDWQVAFVDIATARALVERWHYAAGASNTATYLHGLYRIDNPLLCLGAAWWMPPTRSAAKALFPANPGGVLALSRLAIHPDVPNNAASFLIASSRKMINRKRWPALLTYADEMMGHTGSIYRADNWTFSGYTKPERAYRLNGRLRSRKSGPKTYTHDEMLSRGCEYIGAFRKLRFFRIDPKTPARPHTPLPPTSPADSPPRRPCPQSDL